MKQWSRNQKIYAGAIIVVAILGIGSALYMSRDSGSREVPVPIAPVAADIPPQSEYTVTNPNITCTLSMPPTCGGDITVKSANIDGVQIMVDNNTKVQHKDRDIQLYLDALKEGARIKLTMRPHTSTADLITVLD